MAALLLVRLISRCKLSIIIDADCLKHLKIKQLNGLLDFI